MFTARVSASRLSFEMLTSLFEKVLGNVRLCPISPPVDVSPGSVQHTQKWTPEYKEGKQGPLRSKQRKIDNASVERFRSDFGLSTKTVCM